jgi:hypothetical protein
VRIAIIQAISLLSILFALGSVPGPDLPEIGGVEAIAVVNGEPITLEDLFEQIDMVHTELSDGSARVALPQPSELLGRLIDARLILQEARNIGLDELPEFERRRDEARKELVRRKLAESAVATISEGDGSVVEQLYRNAVRHARVQSIDFHDESQAAEFTSAISAGAEFESLASEALDSGAVEGALQPRTLPIDQMLPEVADAVMALEPGAISQPIKIEERFTLVRLLGFEYPDDPEARQKAERDALKLRQNTALAEYTDSLRERYADVDWKFVSDLDYGPNGPGFEALSNDERIAAKVRGGGSITVAELTAAVEKKFYHGVEESMQRGRVDNEVASVLDRMLLERAATLEADRLGIARDPAFQREMRQLENGLLFGFFLSNVINTDLDLDDQELQNFYEQHMDEYMNPEMYRLRSVAFVAREDAEAALKRLRDGADMDWLKKQAQGQADSEAYPGLLEFKPRRLVAGSTLPAELQETLTGASRGEYRFAAMPEGPYYVLRVEEVFPSTPMPYESVHETLLTRVYREKRQRAVEEWTGRLREASDIAVFVNDDELRSLLGFSNGGDS